MTIPFNKTPISSRPMITLDVYKRQGTARRITARIRHQPGLLDLLPVNLTQTVDSFRYKLRCLVLDSIPLLVGFHIFDAEIRAQIHYPGL